MRRRLLACVEGNGRKPRLVDNMIRERRARGKIAVAGKPASYSAARRSSYLSTKSLNATGETKREALASLSSARALARCSAYGVALLGWAIQRKAQPGCGLGSGWSNSRRD
ncbi:hypothetical protein MPTK1_4g15280 [Marchantia polymorpha subsp. ruderalis]|uniref:Uncharacterized protein n=2 Tax=Marchantia polymorpha TaxID=3197 RepID=A0AAF6BA54_MARPO|nr:hypothetical protein MARPO_0119s0052 [Marchantia polymorpha]BBN08888.1 hypothetical protein Mp_4g15280 [Marchantia polymorpha subsp. ruderalis]|eukprot:PTQ30854.1 hypothetical protein MARPO_0119s0052 [Marchantia polymorpha]